MNDDEWFWDKIKLILIMMLAVSVILASIRMCKIEQKIESLGKPLKTYIDE